MVSQGRYIQAANLMHQQANRALSMEPKLGTKQMWLTAGLADALAAIAVQRKAKIRLLTNIGPIVFDISYRGKQLA